MEQTHVLLDLDGVIVDFVSSALKSHGREEPHDSVTSWNFYEAWGMTDSEFWAPLKGREFWANLEPYPWGVELYRKVAEILPVTITSAPSVDEECTIGKYDWVKKHLGVTPDECMMGKRKHLLAHPLHVLVDDSPANCMAFQNRSGRFIGFKQPWNKFDAGWEDVLSQLQGLVACT